MLLISDSILIMTVYAEPGHCSKSQGFSKEQSLQRPFVDVRSSVFAGSQIHKKS